MQYCMTGTVQVIFNIFLNKGFVHYLLRDLLTLNTVVVHSMQTSQKTKLLSLQH